MMQSRTRGSNSVRPSLWVSSLQSKASTSGTPPAHDMVQADQMMQSWMQLHDDVVGLPTTYLAMAWWYWRWQSGLIQFWVIKLETHGKCNKLHYLLQRLLEGYIEPSSCWGYFMKLILETKHGHKQLQHVLGRSPLCCCKLITCSTLLVLHLLLLCVQNPRDRLVWFKMQQLMFLHVKIN